MPTARPPHDPFTQAALQPTTSNSTSIRSQASQHSLRSSNTSAASNRPRQPNNLFASALSRRPTSRATPRVEDEVLADSDSEQELAVQQRQRQLRRIRHGSPESKHSKHKMKQDDEMEFVNRQPDGSYLMGIGYGESMTMPQMPPLQTEEEVDQAEVDEHYASIAREYFSSGASLGGRNSKRYEENLEHLRLPMMVRLKEQVMQQLEDEKWRYEPLDRY